MEDRLAPRQGRAVAVEQRAVAQLFRAFGAEPFDQLPRGAAGLGKGDLHVRPLAVDLPQEGRHQKAARRRPQEGAAIRLLAFRTEGVGPVRQEQLVTQENPPHPGVDLEAAGETAVAVGRRSGPSQAVRGRAFPGSGRRGAATEGRRAREWR